MEWVATVPLPIATLQSVCHTAMLLLLYTSLLVLLLLHNRNTGLVTELELSDFQSNVPELMNTLLRNGELQEDIKAEALLE